MRRDRLIRPTKPQEFNILQERCRPDKRSASGSFAFARNLRGHLAAPFISHFSASSSCVNFFS
ncbi:hypothetical protein AJR28_009350 [Shigella flexneri]|nr:hypothetical protein AJR23_008510 [Shigella flexneri]OOP08496.1 hypothetical protein AJR22_000570 [Shigella flexneri]OOP10825.1 hypothetical protein AJR24_006660 [Shigella flexneri]OOP20909.1 hypothetical protein AJR25_002835 [Shigella flexneri]OOP22602.1 hypothetical protein AJR27_009695 [Shigella flexneri]